MAKENYVILPIMSESDTSLRVNKEQIAEIKVINTGKKATQNQNWYVQVVLVPGKFYYIKTAGAPYATYALAIAARDTFADSIKAFGGDTSAIENELALI